MRNDKLTVTMVDISPSLLQQQRKTLRGLNAQFIQMDFLEVDESLLSGIDLH